MCMPSPDPTTREAADLTDLTDLRPDEKNANRGTERGQGMLESSLSKYGAGRSILVDREGRVIAGNKTLSAAADLNLPVTVVKTDGHTLVVVQRTDLDLSEDEAARELAYADNRVGQVSLDWDPNIVAADLEAGLDLSLLWSEEELAILVEEADAGGDDGGALGDAGEAPAPPAIATSAPGDVWEFGQHRIVVGDCREIGVLDALMRGEVADIIVTDPPYGVAYVGKTKDALTIDNDALGDAGTRDLVRDALTTAPLKPGGAFYVCSPAGLTETAFRLGIGDAGLQLRECLVWVKQQFVLGRQDYHWRHESILYGWKDGAAHYFVDDRTQDTVWEIDRPSRNAEHPTIKPTEIYIRALNNSSRKGEIALDLFAGSGTLFLAAEATGRKARACELSPNYADVCITRWCDLTGQDATRAADGASWRKLNAGRAAAVAPAAADEDAEDIPF